MLSGEMSLIKGYSEAWAIEAPKAVFPDPGGPCNRILTRGVRVDDRTCSTNNRPDFKSSYIVNCQ